MIEVIRCGPLTSVQDLGREGLRHLGVAKSGAMDPIALQQGNLLVGNQSDAAGLEISVGPLILMFHQDCQIALSGVDFGARLNAGTEPEEQLVPGHPMQIRKGMTLTLQRPSIGGARAYLAISGGIDVPIVLGSRSTDLTAGFGGLLGRSLQAGDALPVGRFFALPKRMPYGVRSLTPTHVLRALPGPDYDAFTVEAQAQFWNQAWGVSHQSNRMGLRLRGQALALNTPLSLLSAGVLPGDVQVPPNGLPIVLANDAQTIGGYPRIASVIGADLWQLAHLPPLTSVNFQAVSHDEAMRASQRQQQYLARLRDSLSAD